MPAFIWAKPLSFATLPMESKQKNIRQIIPMLDYLEQQIHEDINIVYLNDYQEIIDKFSQGHIDLAFLGPLPFVHLSNRYPAAKPLLQFKNRSGKTVYTCSLVTTLDSNLTSPKQLQGKKIALTQPLSTCGYFSVNNMLAVTGLSLEKALYQYVGSHEEALLAVVRGDFDAAGLKTAIAQKYQHLGTQIIANSQSLPGFLLIANETTLSIQQMHTIKDALLKLNPFSNPKDAQLMRNWGYRYRYGVTPAEKSDYMHLNKTLKQLSIPHEGNL